MGISGLGHISLALFVNLPASSSRAGLLRNVKRLVGPISLALSVGIAAHLGCNFRPAIIVATLTLLLTFSWLMLGKKVGKEVGSFDEAISILDWASYPLRNTLYFGAYCMLLGYLFRGRITGPFWQNLTASSLRYFLIAAALIVPCRILAVSTKRLRKFLRAKSARNLLANPASARSTALILYLRPFSDDQFIGHGLLQRSSGRISGAVQDAHGQVRSLSKDADERWVRQAAFDFDRIVKARKRNRAVLYADWTLERELEKALFKYGTFVAVGNDRYAEGALRLHSDPESWRTGVAVLAERAALIICIPGVSEGVVWEVEALLERGLGNVAVFANPGNTLREHQKPWLFEPAPADYGIGYDAGQFAFWQEIEARHARFGFPKFAPLGEWFMLAEERGSEGTYSVADRQPWGTRPVADLLALVQRHDLLRLTDFDRRETKKYMLDPKSHGPASLYGYSSTSMGDGSGYPSV